MCEDAVTLQLTCSSPDQKAWVPVETVFLGRRLYSHIASLHPGVQMGTGLPPRKADKMDGGGVTLWWTDIPSGEGGSTTLRRFKLQKPRQSSAGWASWP